jgi:hypothetical protein
MITDDDKTPVTLVVRRDGKLLALLDAAREMFELRAVRAHLHAAGLEALEAAALAWAATECPICGRRGDHEWEELTPNERLSHEAEAMRQG